MFGNLTGSKLYDVYGATRSISGTPTSRQGFVGDLGHESDDETGLVYMRARYYDPLNGRFASEDPGNQDYNWFLYGADNPVNLVDDTGKAYKMPWNQKVDWFTAGGVCMGVVMDILFTRTSFGKASEVAMFVAVESAMFCFAQASIGMDDAQSVGMNVLGAVAGVTGALMPAFNEATWLTRTEAGVAVACLLTEAVMDSAHLSTVGLDAI